MAGPGAVALDGRVSSLDQVLSFGCAAAAAGGNALANVMQRKASLEGERGRQFGAGVMRDLVRSTTWLLGFGGMVASFGLQAVALSLGQLSSVETIITLEVPLTLLVASRVFRVHVGAAEWTGIWVMTLGMVALIAVLNPQPGDETDVSRTIYAVAGSATAVFVLTLVLAAQRGARLWRAGCLGAAAGASFGLTATLIKETTAQLSAHGLIGMLSTWQTYAAIGVGLSGVLVMQWALHIGPLLAAQPGLTLMDPIVSILWGVLVYNETTRSGPWLVPAVLAAGAIATGVLLLARSPLLTALNEADSESLHPAAPGGARALPS